MKYKNINSAIHNLGHSFMSGMNYFDSDHVMYEVHALASREKWPHPFEQQPEFLKWTLCQSSRCQFTRRQHHGIGFIRCLLVQARMRSGSVVPLHVLHDRLPSFTDGVVRM